jgi:hypothetical protein
VAAAGKEGTAPVNTTVARRPGQIVASLCASRGLFAVQTRTGACRETPPVPDIFSGSASS